MKLDKRALLEIVDIVREGLTEGKDISAALRELDLVESKQDATFAATAFSGEAFNTGTSVLVLSPDYLKTHSRSQDN